jgi:hypothetical protein
VRRAAARLANSLPWPCWLSSRCPTVVGRLRLGSRSQLDVGTRRSSPRQKRSRHADRPTQSPDESTFQAKAMSHIALRPRALRRHRAGSVPAFWTPASLSSATPSRRYGWVRRCEVSRRRRSRAGNRFRPGRWLSSLRLRSSPVRRPISDGGARRRVGTVGSAVRHQMVPIRRRDLIARRSIIA